MDATLILSANSSFPVNKCDLDFCGDAEGIFLVAFSNGNYNQQSTTWKDFLNDTECWRDGTAVKNTGCSSGGPRCRSQHPDDGSQQSATLALRDQTV